MAKVYATPGVYIEEKSAFPNSAVPVATAVPAFIGYTERAIFNKKDLTGKPTRLSSFGEFLLYFGGAAKTTYAVENIRKTNPNQIYDLSPLKNQFLLYNSMRLFFANGGSDCYVVSIGNYSNPVNLKDLQKGFEPLLKEPEPTMVVIPEAMLLEEAECYSLQQQMLLHCGAEMRSRISILDVYNGNLSRSPIKEEDVINRFREGIGGNFLQWGAAYYPWISTTIVGADEVDFTNIDPSAMNTFMDTLKEEVQLDLKAGLIKQDRANEINAQIRAMPEAGLHAGVTKLFEGLNKLAKQVASLEFTMFADAGTALGTLSGDDDIPANRREKFAETDLGKTAGGFFNPTLEAIQFLQGFDPKGALATPKTDKKDNAVTDLTALAEVLQPLVEQLEEGELSSAAARVRRHENNLSSAAAEIGALPDDADEAAVKAKFREIMGVKDAEKAPEDVIKDIQDDIAAVKASYTEDETIKNVVGLIPFNPFLPAADRAKALSGYKEEDLESLPNRITLGVKGQKDPQTLHQTLVAISPLYKAMLATLREDLNLMPPSAGMAGIYSMVDGAIGVWQSPANVSIGSVIKPAVNITNDQQEDLNVPLNGKAINAIRTFPGKGPLVWGARTLDGNSQDWQYVSVRRTVIFIEQSIKYAAEAYVFEPNTASTWTNLKALLTNFLTNVWQQGALAGATPEDAFSVDIGLGVTMTPVDILDGIMRITIKLAVTRPAEFIVITFQQQMQKS